MNVSNPDTAASVKQSVQNIIDALYASEFGQQNVDLRIDMVGVLNYTSGVKLRLNYVDSFDDDDVDSWRSIARQHGAIHLRTKVNTTSGVIDLNIEYKKRKSNTQWLLRSATLLLAGWSYQQLHLLNQQRYPLPIALSE